YEEEQKIFTDARVETVTKLYRNRERQAGLAHLNLMPTRWPSTFEIKLFTERFLQSKPADIKTLQPQFDDDEVASTSTYIQKKSLIQSVPKGMKNLTNLRSLQLQHNELKTFPWKIIEEMPDLEELLLCGNRLEKIPKEIGNLTRCEQQCLLCKSTLAKPTTCICFEYEFQVEIRLRTLSTSLMPQRHAEAQKTHSGTISTQGLKREIEGCWEEMEENYPMEPIPTVMLGGCTTQILSKEPTLEEQSHLDMDT
ncbi:uncharacterized protein LOC102806987, partial [Saccoglossus kowalevskii]